MMAKNHAEICPVCKGKGKVSVDIKDGTRYTGNIDYAKMCYGCNGKGWVTVRDEQGGIMRCLTWFVVVMMFDYYGIIFSL